MLQEPIDTEKLRLFLDDQMTQAAMAEYVANPGKDLELSSEELMAQDIPMYSLSEVFPDFKKLFKPLKRSKQLVSLSSLCGTVERQFERYSYGFVPLQADNPDVASIVTALSAGTFKSEETPIIVHAIPFRNKFEGFVADGAHIVAAHKIAGLDKIWAEVTFYKALKS
jgi:hypothetical protein